MSNIIPSKTKMGSRRGIETTAVAWIDLLGYGSMLQKAAFDPTSHLAQKAVERLKEFHAVLKSRASRLLRLFSLNDGAIAFRDLSPRSRYVTFEMIKLSTELFNEVNTRDIQKGYPGARMILASGFRVRIPTSRESLYNVELAKILRERLKSGEISAHQALEEALRNRPAYEGILELEANFALTKAYMADSGGSKVGLPGPACYIDLALLEDCLPEWISFSKTIDWCWEGLATTFGEFTSLDTMLAATERYKGALDAFEVAKRLSPFCNVERRLRESRIKNRQKMTESQVQPKQVIRKRRR